MATPRTGRPRGRPPKVKELEPKRSQGRPNKRLASDPDRYLLAAIQAHIEINRPRRISETRIAELFAGLRFGKPVRTRENFEAMNNRAKFRVFLDKWQRGDEGGKNYRDRNAFRPLADNLRRKLSNIRNRPTGDLDRRWLALMTRAWLPCLRGERERAFGASLEASLAGETAYFYAVMFPLMMERDRQRDAGAERAKVNLPEFRDILLPTISATQSD